MTISGKQRQINPARSDPSLKQNSAATPQLAWRKQLKSKTNPRRQKYKKQKLTSLAAHQIYI